MEVSVAAEEGVVFICPNCLREDDTINSRYTKIQEASKQIYNNDGIERLIELWYCYWCGHYFRVYYTLEKITTLKEVE